MISILGYPILIKKMFDAEQMKWEQLENEYVAPLIDTTISHGLKKVINSYDTFEKIETNNTRSKQVSSLQEELVESEIEHSSKFTDRITDTTTISNSVVNGQDLSIDTNFWNDLDSSNDFEVSNE